MVIAADSPHTGKQVLRCEERVSCVSSLSAQARVFPWLGASCFLEGLNLTLHCRLMENVSVQGGRNCQ